MSKQDPDADEDLKQVETWQLLYDRIREFMLTVGTESHLHSADCWVHDDNWGSKQQKIYVRNLKLLRPSIIKSFQQMLQEFPDWEIIIAVSMPAPVGPWPDMGLTIRAHEIIDGLQRQYFPPEHRGIQYEGSRPGTDRD